jgi:hypothetical protein
LALVQPKAGMRKPMPAEPHFVSLTSSRPALVWPFLALLFLVACSGLPPSGADGATQVRFVIGKVCLPVLADRVSFEEIVAAQKLRRRRDCDIQGCIISYCVDGPRGFCFQPPTDRNCWVAIPHDAKFADLNSTVVSVLGSDARKWRPVPPTPTPQPLGDARAFCSEDGSVEVISNAVREGQIMGYVPRPLSGIGGGAPIRMLWDEFDVHVASPPFGSSCARQ